ncbi:MAG: hypothetical protein ACYDHZ_03090 [Dehalococcoidia bacterium]
MSKAALIKKVLRITVIVLTWCYLANLLVIIVLQLRNYYDKYSTVIANIYGNSSWFFVLTLPIIAAVSIVALRSKWLAIGTIITGALFISAFSYGVYSQLISNLPDIHNYLLYLQRTWELFTLVYMLPYYLLTIFIPVLLGIVLLAAGILALYLSHKAASSSATISNS